MTVTIINSIIVITLGIIVIKRRNRYSIIFALFLYISLHYTYTALPIFWLNKFGHLRLCTQLGAKLIGIGFLFISAGLLFFQNKKRIISNIRLEVNKWLYITFGLWILMVGISWAVGIANQNFPSSIALHDILSAFLLVMFALIFAFSLKSQSVDNPDSLKKMWQVLLVLVIIMNIISLYQVLFFKCFAYTPNKSGDLEVRACALLFNPNVLGFWYAIIASTFAYAYHSQKCSKGLSALILILTSFGIFLSGSRSGLLICLFMLGISALLQFWISRRDKKLNSFYPVLIFISGLTVIGLVFKILDSLTKQSYECLHALSVLVDRFAYMPREIITYGLIKLTGCTISFLALLADAAGYSISIEYLLKFNDFLNKDISTSVFISIDGRLNADLALVDNGYLAMYNDVGWPGLLAWIFLWIVFIRQGVKILRVEPGTSSAYALAAVLSCLFSAIFMRLFQVFPFWILVAMILGISLSWFQTVFARNNLYSKDFTSL